MMCPVVVVVSAGSTSFAVKRLLTGGLSISLVALPGLPRGLASRLPAAPAVHVLCALGVDLNLPEERRVNNLTAGVLRGPGKLAVHALVRARKDEKESYVILHVGRALCGHDGIVHGGLLATLLDESLARNVGIIFHYSVSKKDSLCHGNFGPFLDEHSPSPRY